MKQCSAPLSRMLSCLSLAFSLFICPLIAFAQPAVPLTDRNGDGLVQLLAFGDSLTFGVGDGTRVGSTDTEEAPLTNGNGGYPRRVGALSGILTSNEGVPGELLTDGGSDRFPTTLFASSADGVVILEGSNDAVFQITTESYGRSLQKVVNIARAVGVTPYVATVPTPCCNRSGQGRFTEAYARVAREISAINEVPLVDIQRAFDIACNGDPDCFVYNRPEGLHPNGAGYDIMAEAISAQLFGFDIFTAEGFEALAAALGREPSELRFPMPAATESDEESEE